MAIVKVTLKDPDGIHDCLKDAIDDEAIRAEIKKRFFEFGDYCEIEIDTETMLAKVVEVSN